MIKLLKDLKLHEYFQIEVNVLVLIDFWDYLITAYCLENVNELGQPSFFGLINQLDHSSLKVPFDILTFL